MSKHSLVRTIYLYIFSLLGLVLLIIGGIRFIDMGLKAFVFTQAEEEERLMHQQVPPIPNFISESGETQQNIQKGESVCLSSEEKTILNHWLTAYREWQAKQSKIDFVRVKRQKNASINLALILIGLPLYLYHWHIIRREMENQKEQS